MMQHTETSTGGREDRTAQAPLRLEVFTSPTREIPNTQNTFSPVTSTLILGEKDAVLVDAQFIKEDIDALADMIESFGTSLGTIYITHGHADHYFGINRLLARFPDARAVATASVVDYIAATREREADISDRMFGSLAEHPIALPTELEEDVILLDGHELKAIEIGQGDIASSTVLHIPALDAVVAGDVVYNQIHQMMAFGGPKEWQAWIESVNRIESLNPNLLVAGHKSADASDQDVASILDGTRSYIRDFAEAVRTSESAGEVISVMRDSYPERGNMTTLVFSAAAAFRAS